MRDQRQFHRVQVEGEFIVFHSHYSCVEIYFNLTSLLCQVIKLFVFQGDAEETDIGLVSGVDKSKRAGNDSLDTNA